MTTSRNRQLLLVVAMHRSGTSALCAALHASGATFGTTLLEAMPGVNDGGFWEDRVVVDINERLLAAMGASWYTACDELVGFWWQAEEFSDLRDEAFDILQRGFGAGPLEVVKDPRFCITLPFWLDLCKRSEIDVFVCVANRAPIEVARSLEKRDGFPLGFGLRLYSSYRKLIEANVPSDAFYASFDALLADPLGVMQSLTEVLPLAPDQDTLAAAVRCDLKHQVGSGGMGFLDQADTRSVDFVALDAEIEKLYPQQNVVDDLVQALVARGVKLSEKGVEFQNSLAELSNQHIQALTTIDERDGQIELIDGRLTAAGAHLSHALAILPERDLQILDIQEKLAALGEQHSYALQIVQQRDQQLKEESESRERLFSTPLVGRLIRKLWSNAQR